MKVRVPSIPVAETLRFVLEVLPDPPIRTLEVGAGDGALAVQLAARAFSIVALDHSAESIAAARARGLEAVEADFLKYESLPFDALLFTRSLHHMEPVTVAVERARMLLKPEGILVIEDFAFDRADLASVEWLAMHEVRLRTKGLLPLDEEPLFTGDPLQNWITHHRDRHSVHTGDEILAALEEHFDLERVETAPYLYRYLATRLTASSGADSAAGLLEEERREIAAGRVRAIGMRIIARPK